MDEEGFNPGTGFGDIIDESTEPPLSAFVYDNSKEQEYLAKTTAAAHEERPFRMLYPEHFARLQIAKALLGRLWSKGHFKLGNLKLWAQWEWDPSPVGNMSAFYRSVESASEYIYGLGVNLEDYLFIEGDEGCNAKFYAWLDNEYDMTLFKSSPFESSHPWIGEERACSSTINPDPESWIIYIPFDTCGYRLGASLLTEVAEHNGGKAPDIADPDYFIDCYEVVRELVEDGFVISGRTVADGGLITAAKNMCGQYGIDMDIKGIMSSYQEERCRVLFGEIPGVIIQVSDENYDYIDSQLLLQDIAYYPIGHPRENDSDLNISETGKNGVADILISLLGHASEGED
jgi:phosphoribosylformylglycinamidine synthase